MSFTGLASWAGLSNTRTLAQGQGARGDGPKLLDLPRKPTFHFIGGFAFWHRIGVSIHTYITFSNASVLDSTAGEVGRPFCTCGQVMWLYAHSGQTYGFKPTSIGIFYKCGINGLEWRSRQHYGFIAARLRVLSHQLAPCSSSSASAGDAAASFK
jgi:hypothetical protein